jgi:hypothetical protein
MPETNIGKQDVVIIYPSEALVIIRKSDYDKMKSAQQLLGDILLTAGIAGNATSFHRWVMAIGSDQSTEVIMAAVRASSKWNAPTATTDKPEGTQE